MAKKMEKHCCKPKYEAILLSWLEVHCNVFQRNYWPEIRLKINDKKKMDFNTRSLENLDEQLSDGVVFIAVTIVHCPFLIDQYFGNIFWNAINEEQVFLHVKICFFTIIYPRFDIITENS